MSDDKSDGSGPDGEHHEEFLSLFKRGLRFTEELMAENEQLRFKIASLEARVGSAGDGGVPVPDEVSRLQKRVEELEAERQRLIDSFKQVEDLNRDYKSRYAEIEEEHNNLANLYIASYQLHSTLSFREVMQVVTEIIINLIGVARFAIYLHHQDTQDLVPVVTEDLDLASLENLKLGEGPIGTVAKEGDPQVNEDGGDAPVAIVPLATLETVVGVIVIHRLLEQKPALTTVDHELFTLLGAHAATGLLGGFLRARADAQTADLIDVEEAKRLLG